MQFIVTWHKQKWYLIKFYFFGIIWIINIFYLFISACDKAFTNGLLNQIDIENPALKQINEIHFGTMQICLKTYLNNYYYFIFYVLGYIISIYSDFFSQLCPVWNQYLFHITCIFFQIKINFINLPSNKTRAVRGQQSSTILNLKNITLKKHKKYRWKIICKIKQG